MLFSDTIPAIRAREQTVARRFGKEFEGLKPGDKIEAVASGWMLSYTGKVPVLANLVVVSVRTEPLRRLTDDPTYGAAEQVQEGLSPEMPVRARVASLISRHRALTLDSDVVRIEFKYS